ncbi:MAG TPA: deoxyribodipyrimidine photolyase, partial [Armatimonadetes bacterium]|nr:deoxyribodipyrimidine photolyase [Armatimonadota bacterium]
VWDGLYWRTIARNREFFAQNQRMSQAVRGYERLEPTRRDRILAAAEGFIESVTVAG